MIKLKKLSSIPLSTLGPEFKDMTEVAVVEVDFDQVKEEDIMNKYVILTQRVKVRGIQEYEVEEGKTKRKVGLLI